MRIDGDELTMVLNEMISVGVDRMYNAWWWPVTCLCLNVHCFGRYKPGYKGTLYLL